MVENVALIDLSEAPRVLLRLLGASRLSLSRRGSGLIDPVTGRPSDLYRIVVRGDLGEQASREVFIGLIEGSDAKAPDPIKPERLAPRHKSLRSDDYLFECSPFENERAADPIAPVARGQVEGAFLEAGEGQIASSTCGLSATLDLYRSTRLDDRLSYTRTDPGGNGALVETAFAEKLLGYDAILIHLDHTKPNLANSGETVVDILNRAAALIGQGSVGSVARIRRVVLAVGDVGRLRLDEGTVVPLKDMSSVALFRMSYDPVARSWPALTAALANLASTIELSAEDGRRCPFLFVPYDFFGDIAGHECLNRDPINGERDLLTMGGVIDVKASVDPLWRPFNLADVIFAATTQGVQSTSIFLVEE